MTARETAAQIEDAALRWVWRLDQSDADPAIEAELEAWLAGDTRRRGALLQAQAAWARLDQASAMGVVQNAPSKARPTLSRRAVWTAGGAIAASVVGFGVWLAGSPVYATRLGEIRRLPLEDGSVVALNTDSRIAVQVGDDRRRVALRQGEAWFQVAKDPARPFVVEAGRVRVRAVGTAFSVRRRETGAEILVSEGVVEAWCDGAEGHVVRIAAGREAFVTEQAAITVKPPQSSDVDRRLAWRAGKIDLRGQTLASAVDEFNRYNTAKLAVADPALAEEPLFGIFRIDDPRGFARAAAVSLNTSAQVRSDGTIAIGG